MAKFTWNETFISLEGEFLFQGFPTIYLRLSGCSFTCRKFNNPENVVITNEVLGFNPKDYSNLRDLPVISIGCDSLYAHDKRFKHLWKDGTEDDVVDSLISLLPHNQWKHPVTKLPYIFSLTGGCPLLHQKSIPALLNHPKMIDLDILLIETNCSVKLQSEFISELNSWVRQNPSRKIVWSNSPKLSSSGEPKEKAIRPDIAVQQTTISNYQQYFKFVCGPLEESFDEVEQVMEMYYAAGVSPTTPVGIMPEACTAEQQIQICRQVAEMCIRRGYVYVHRLQNTLWGNQIGT